MPSVTRVRVRYKDTDTVSVVYYGNYLTYFEVGRVEYLREYGWPMSAVNERVHLPVVEAFVKYVRPARLDDLLEVTSRVSERKRASSGSAMRSTTRPRSWWRPGTPCTPAGTRRPPR
jgi:acyl-CoA thioester hydrolase